MATVDRPISAVLHDIVGNVQDIIRSEVRLAKTELREEMAKSKSAALLMAAGVLLLFFGTLFMLLAVVFALTAVMPPWAAALSVGVGVGVVAAFCLARALGKIRTIRAAPKTAATMKENLQWAKRVSK